MSRKKIDAGSDRRLLLEVLHGASLATAGGMVIGQSFTALLWREHARPRDALPKDG